jgi:hypothetical protein
LICLLGGRLTQGALRDPGLCCATLSALALNPLNVEGTKEMVTHWPRGDHIPKCETIGIVASARRMRYHPYRSFLFDRVIGTAQPWARFGAVAFIRHGNVLRFQF